MNSTTGTPTDSTETHPATRRAEARDVRAAREHARHFPRLSAFERTSLREAERHARHVRSMMGSSGLMASVEAARQAAAIAQSASWQPLALHSQRVWTEMGMQAAEAARRALPPSFALDIFNSSGLRESIEQARAATTLGLTGMLEEMARTVARQQMEWTRGPGSQFLAGVTFPEVDIRQWLPAIHFPPPPEPGTIMGDLLIVQWDATSEDDRVAALDRLISAIPWRATRDARLALDFRAACERRPAKLVKRDALRAGLLLALDGQDQPQKHRYGTSWVTDENGRQVEFIPSELPLEGFWEWLQDETPKAAEACLLHQPYPPPPPTYQRSSRPLLQDQQPDPEHGRDPERLVIRREEMLGHFAALRHLLDIATPGQRRLLFALAIEQRTNAEATVADAARRLGISPHTARWQRMKLFARLGLGPNPTLRAYLSSLN